MLLSSLAVLALAQPLPSADFGRSEADVAPGVAFTDDPKLAELTRMSRPTSLLGRPATTATLGFWNHRLFEIELQFPEESFDELVTALKAELGEPWRLELDKPHDKSAAWSLPQGALALYQVNQHTVVRFWDDSQKELRLSDFLHGTGLALIGTVLGLFLAMFLIASAVSAWCPSCHSFGMREAGRSVDGYRDHSADPFSTNLRADVSYRYVCSKCGHRKVDRYSGFWDRNRPR